MLVGNKSDLRHLRAVPTEEARSYAGNHISILGLCKLENEILKPAKNAENHFFRPRNVIFERFSIT